MEAPKQRFTDRLPEFKPKRHGPIIAIIVLFVVVVAWRGTSHSSSKDVSADTATAVVDELAKKGALGNVIAPTPTTAATPPPRYDYVTCTHWRPGDRPCTPLREYPLTTEAQQLIGWQNGTRVNGTLDSDNTRAVADGILSLPNVDACSMYLGLKEDDHHILVRTVYPDQASASVGAVKLYDCTPKTDPKTQVTAPTAGHE